MPVDSQYVANRSSRSIHKWKVKMLPQYLISDSPMSQSSILSALQHVGPGLVSPSYTSSQPSLHDWFRALALRKCVITVEDKDPSVLWSHDPSGFLYRWMLCIYRAPDRWTLISMQEREVLTYDRLVYDSSYPANLQRKHASSSFSARCIPSARASVKRKCWANEHDCVSRVCQKPSHSCFRNLIFC